MQIAVLGTSRSGTDRRTIRLVASLAAAGNDVTFLSPGSVDRRIDEVVNAVIAIDTRWPQGGGGIAGLLRRGNPSGLRRANMHRRAVALLEKVQPDLVYVSDPELVGLIDGLGFTIASDTKILEGVTNDLATLAPQDPTLAGLADAGDTPWVRRPISTPERGRHRGKRIVLCYHPTDTSPARYLHAALARAGVAVDHRYPGVDLSDVDPDTDGVVFVESPYPALDVTGESPVPVLYWVHHGEIHLYQNIRLAQRYRADGVLLAHSWHLAHRFSAQVFRFPFGVPTEMLADSVTFDDRTTDVSMVAAGFDDTGRRYAARRALADTLTQELGQDHVLFTGGLSPDEVFSTYANSKAVIDEGGSLHRPITMRVFEATGSGAALVAEPAPGLDLLFEPDAEFIRLDIEDPIASLPSPDAMRSVARAGNTRALGTHTYDHRVDELLTILSHSVPLSRGTAEGRSPDAGGSARPPGSSADPPGSETRQSPLKGGRPERGVPPSRGTAEGRSGVPLSRGTAEGRSPDAGGSAQPIQLQGFLGAVERFAEIDSVACGDRAAESFVSTSYLVWSHGDVTERHMTVDAVVVDDDSVLTDDLLQRAHRFVFSSGDQAPTVATMLTQAGRPFIESSEADVHVFDFATPGYIVRESP